VTADYVALLIASAAFTVSVTSLYLTSLRPAEIELDHVRQPEEIQLPGFSGAFPGETTLVLALFISNAGARGGLFQELRLSDFAYSGEDPPYWVGVTMDVMRPVTVPLALEAGDVKTSFLHVRLLPAGGYTREDPTPLARQLRGLASICVLLHWTFIRTAGCGSVSVVDATYLGRVFNAAAIGLLPGSSTAAAARAGAPQ
jgi:hypothetical protein